MKKTLLFLNLFAITFFLNAQDLNIPAFGTDSTLEVMTWNVEWFPKNGQTTVDYVTEIITDLDVDLIAMQEIDDKTFFDQLIENLDGYDGYYVNSQYSNLAYLYKTSVIQVAQIEEIYTTEEYWRPFPRAPMVIEFMFNNEKYFVINNHLKCCGDGIMDTSDPWDEETRRRDACILLDEYIKTDLQNEKVIMLGDLNDILTDDFANNVFNVFIENESGYLFTDMEIAEGSTYSWSYPTWPSHLDHQLITKELFNDFSNFGSEILTIRLDDFFSSWSQYDNNVSDHRPVAMKIKPLNYLGENEIAVNDFDLTNSPNPVQQETTIHFQAVSANSKLEIVDLMGNKVESFFIHPEQTSVRWDAAGYPNGIYLARLTQGNNEVAMKKMVVLR